MCGIEVPYIPIDYLLAKAMIWYLLVGATSCNFELLIDQYKNLPLKPANCAPYHRGLGSVIKAEKI